MTSLRDLFLSECRKDRMLVTVFTTNGFQMKGVIRAFDSDVVIIDQTDGKQAMVYRHAISTMVPAKNVLV